MEAVKAAVKAAADRKSSLVVHRSSVRELGWSHCGTYLASAAVDRSLALTKMAAGRLVKEMELKGHSENVERLCWRQDDRPLLATVSTDKSCRLWDPRQGGKCTMTIATDGEAINISMHPDGTTIACGDKHDVLSFFDVRTGKRLHKKAYDYEINQLSWDRHGRFFYITTSLGTIDIVEYPSLANATEPLHPHFGNCSCIEFDLQDTHFASGGSDSLVAIFDASELICLSTLSYLEFPVRHISFSHDGSLVTACSEDTNLSITHVETNTVLQQLPTPDGSFSVAFHPKSLALAYAPSTQATGSKDKEGVVELIA